MKFQRILFPTDFSQDSAAALSVATSMAKDHGADLLIMHVFEAESAHPGGMGAALSPPPVEQRQEAEKALNETQPSREEVACRRFLVEGPPAAGIVKLARDQQADLIVLGTHGRTGVRRLLMGSVAESVVRNAPCPVLTIRSEAGVAGPG